MRDFKWGFSTLGCPECSLGEAVALADEYDFRMLELRSVDGSIDLPKVFEEPEKRALLKRLAGEGRIRVFGSSFGISSRRNNYEELAALGRLADEAGVPYLRVFGGFDFAEELDSEKLTVALENLAWFRGQNLKAKLALETHDGYSSAARCRRLLDRVDGELPVIWDAHHTCRFAGETFRDSWELLAGHVVDIHVRTADSIRTASSSPPFRARGIWRFRNCSNCLKRSITPLWSRSNTRSSGTRICRKSGSHWLL